MERGSWPENGRRLLPLHAALYDYPIRSLASHGSVHLTSQSRIRATAYGREASRRKLAFTRRRKSRKSAAKVRKVRAGILGFLFLSLSLCLCGEWRRWLISSEYRQRSARRIASSRDEEARSRSRCGSGVVSIFDSFVRAERERPRSFLRSL